MRLPTTPALAAVAVLLVVATAARASMRLPGPNINVHVRFENLDDYPDFDFYLKYGLSDGNCYRKHTLTKLASGVTTRLEGEGHYMTPVYLVAVPRRKAPPALPAPNEDDSEWHAKTAPGTLQSPALEVSAEDSGYICPYRATLEGKVLSATALPLENLPEARARTRLGFMCVGLALSAVVAVWACGWPAGGVAHHRQRNPRGLNRPSQPRARRRHERTRPGTTTYSARA